MDGKNKLKNKLKAVSGQKQRCIQTPDASKKTQQLSKLTQQHLIFPKKEKLKAYVTVCRKPAYIRGYPSKNRVYTWLWSKNSRIGRKRDKKVGKQTNWDKIYSYQTLLGKHAPRPDSEIEKSEQFKNIECRSNPQRKWLGSPQYGHQFCYGENFLWLGVPQ